MKISVTLSLALFISLSTLACATAGEEEEYFVGETAADGGTRPSMDARPRPDARQLPDARPFVPSPDAGLPGDFPGGGGDFPGGGGDFPGGGGLPGGGAPCEDTSDCKAGECCFTLIGDGMCMAGEESLPGFCLPSGF